MTDLPYHVAPSLIHGMGAFATRFIRQGEVVPMPYSLNFRGFNHSCDPNLSPREWDNRRRALRNILPGEEITVSYGWKPIPEEKCQCPIHRSKR